MPWVYIEEEYKGPRKTCHMCDGDGRIMYSNPPSPRDACHVCGGAGWLPETEVETALRVARENLGPAASDTEVEEEAARILDEG